MAPEKVDEMADDLREDPEVIVNTFLQHKRAWNRRRTTWSVVGASPSLMLPR